MIFVTHDQTEAMTLGQRLCVMNDGLVMQTGTPLEVYNRPRNMFVAGFIGNPGMNFLRGALSSENGNSFFLANKTESQLRIPISQEQSQKLDGFSERDIVFGIRPENLEILTSMGADDFERSFSATVNFCEVLGHETLVHLSVGKQTLILRTSSALAGFETGQSIRLSCDPANAHFFDPESGESIT
jgi:multiple sugar transport system ATP-binding protein